MKMNMMEWTRDIIQASDVKNLPILYFPLVKKAGYSIPESVSDSVKSVNVMKKVIDEYPDIIAAVTGMDLTIDAEAFGAEVNLSEKQAPNVINHILNSQEDIEELELPDINTARVDVFTQACTEASRIIHDRPVFGGMLGPFSLAANLLEINKCMIMTLRNKASLHLLLEKCSEWLIKRAFAFKEAGANGILIAEPTAGLLSPAACEAFSSSYVRKIVEAVQDDYFYLILHNCGQVTRSAKSMYETGCKGLHFGNGVDMRDIMPQIGQDILVFGNLDPSEVFFLGTPETVYEKTMELLKEMEAYPNFVLSTGCDLAPSIEEANIQAYFNACRDYNKKEVHHAI